MADEDIKIGPHLLGRKHVHDPRDYPMKDALEELDRQKKNEAAAASSSPPPEFWQAIIDFLAWLRSIFGSVTPTPPAPTPTPTPTPSPTPTPAPTPAPTSTLWNLTTQLNQGNTGHCVGFGWTSWENSDPVTHTFDNAHAHAYYYACKVVDGEPGQEDGSTVRSGAKVAQNRKELNTYVFASTVDEVKQWVLLHGPVVCGTDWTNPMFNPDANGFVAPTGSVAGGHCYIMIGYDTETDVFTFQNSWGSNWGLGGRFKMKATDFAKLLARQGDACAANEIL